MNEEKLLYKWPEALLGFATSQCSGNPVLILEGSGRGSAGSPSCHMLWGRMSLALPHSLATPPLSAAPSCSGEWR